MILDAKKDEVGNGNSTKFLALNTSTYYLKKTQIPNFIGPLILLIES